MDGYHYSSKDGPRDESMSYSNHDYTNKFTTDQIFESKEDMLAWVRSVGLQNGIVVVISKSANLKGRKLPKCILGCERGGAYKSHKSSGLLRKRLCTEIGTKKCGCPFELRGIPIPPDELLMYPKKNIPPDGVRWGVKVSCGVHNHEPTENFEGHEYPSRLATPSLKSSSNNSTGKAPTTTKSIMDAEPGRCRRIDGKQWRCGKEVIPNQKYCERHMHRGRGCSRKLMEAPEIPLESAPGNLQLATPSLKSSSNNSTGKSPTTPTISSISGNEYRIYAKKELSVISATATATATTMAAITTTATPTTNGINKEGNKNGNPSKDTTSTTCLWSAGSDKSNKCTTDSNNSVGKAPTTSAICSISGSENKIYAKQDSTFAPATATTTTAATPTANGMDKESDKNIYHSKDTTTSMTTGLLRAGSEKINICTSNSECLGGKDAGYKHLNNINIRQSKDDRHAGYAGSSVASRLGFSSDSVLQVVGYSSSCLNYRNDVETGLQRCRSTDGKKWRCGADVLPDQMYCKWHLDRGSKKLVVGEPVKVTSAPLPRGIFRATPLAIPKNESGCIDLNTNLSLSIAASPQLTDMKEKNNTSCGSSSDPEIISDDNNIMDGYHFSSKDGPRDESMSYSNHDYTNEFTTDQIFESKEDMLAWVRSVGLQNGIVVVISKSANLKGRKLPRCILGCERGGTYRSRGRLRKRLREETETKKCECPFELRGIPIPPDGVRWGVKVSCGVHNHEPVENFEGHEYPSRLKPAERQFVVDMANSTTPREILRILKQKDPSNTTGIKSIYYAIQSHKKTKRGGLNITQQKDPSNT